MVGPQPWPDTRDYPNELRHAGAAAAPRRQDAVARARRAEYDASVDKRLTILETCFDAILPTLATKADVAELRGETAVGFERMRVEMATLSDRLHQDMLQMFQRVLLWMIGICVTLSLATFGGTLAIMDMMLDPLRDDIKLIRAAVVPAMIQAPAPAEAPPPRARPAPAPSAAS